MTKFVVCRSKLQLDFKTVSRTGKMLWEFETGFETLYNMLAKKGYQTVYASMLLNPMMPAHCVSKVSFVLCEKCFSPSYCQCHAFRSASSSYYALGKIKELK